MSSNNEEKALKIEGFIWVIASVMGLNCCIKRDCGVFSCVIISENFTSIMEKLVSSVRRESLVELHINSNNEERKYCGFRNDLRSSNLLLIVSERRGNCSMRHIMLSFNLGIKELSAELNKGIILLSMYSMLITLSFTIFIARSIPLKWISK
jgi:hypothetical protein